MKDSHKETIYLGTDHAGFSLKEHIKVFLEEKGHNVVDCGNTVFAEDDDYPDFIFPVAHAVAESPDKRKGIVFGYSGQGEAIAANRMKDVRAAVFYGGSEEILTLAREHNNANVLSLGAGFVSEEEAEKAVALWLGAAFGEQKRHMHRINKIDEHSGNR